MFHYSASSKRHLPNCDERIQRVFNKVIQHYDCTIICGHRGKAAQTLAFENGQSQVNWPDTAGIASSPSSNYTNFPM